MIDPMTIHTPIDAIEKAKEHAREAEQAFASAVSDSSYVEDVAMHTQLAQAWATIAIAQRSGR